MVFVSLFACSDVLGLDTGVVEAFTSEVEAWEPGDSDTDPLGSHRPVDDRCPVASWRPDGGALEVETGACHYAWLVQEVPADLVAGSVLSADVWHSALDALEPAEGHVALVLDGELIWEATRSIPGEPGILEVDVVLQHDVEAGALLGLHLHNHGDNAWNLGPVTIRPPP